MQSNNSPTTTLNKIDPHLIIPYSELIFHKKLAENSLTQVYLGQWCGLPVAIKSLKNNDIKTNLNQFIIEAKILSQIHCAYIVQFYAICIESELR